MDSYHKNPFKRYRMKFRITDSIEGSKLISTRDAYIESFSEFDIASRTNNPKTNSVNKMLQYLSNQTLNWSGGEKEMLSEICGELCNYIERSNQYQLDEVLVAKTTGLDDSDAAYTRANVIYLPQSMVNWRYDDLEALIAHEVFHVISTYNPEYRNDLYKKLGFIHCADIAIPEQYKKLSVSNPDTIGKNCYILVNKGGRTIKAVPFLYSDTPYQGGYFFDYLRFSFVACRVSGEKCVLLQDSNQPVFVDPPELLFELNEEFDPYNNQHNLHPEEMLAHYWSYSYAFQEVSWHPLSSFLARIGAILDDEGKSVIT